MHRNGQNYNHLHQNGFEYKWNHLFPQSPHFGIETKPKNPKKEFAKFRRTATASKNIDCWCMSWINCV